MALLQFDEIGIYCKQADVYIDPWKAVKKALITHAHADHARWGSASYLCYNGSVNLLKLRLGKDIVVQGLAYDEPIYLNGVKVTFHPAGHIIGSAQIRLEYKGEVWVVSGDYKLTSDGVSDLFEPIKCQHFITESTFGLPIYRFPPAIEVHNEINNWWQQCASQNKNAIILGYSLGKAQSILKHLDPNIGPIFLHGAVDNIQNVVEADGYQFPNTKRIIPDMKKGDFSGAIIIAPPSVLGTSWLKRFEPYETAFCSGWMQIRGKRRWRATDRGFVLSDHCDWDQLNEAVQLTTATNIYVTHGYKHQYAKYLTEQWGLNAAPVDTLYDDEDVDLLTNDTESI